MAQDTTNVLLQVGLDIEAITCKLAIRNSLGLTNEARQKMLTSTFKTKPGSGSGRDVIKYPTCSNTLPYATKLNSNNISWKREDFLKR